MLSCTEWPLKFVFQPWSMKMPPESQTSDLEPKARNLNRAWEFLHLS